MEWGWAEISIGAVPSHERPKAVAVLQKEWAGLEGFTLLRLLKSQTTQFEFATSTATVLVRRDLLKSLVDNAQREVASISVAFTPVDKPVSTAEEANMILATRQ